MPRLNQPSPRTSKTRHPYSADNCPLPPSPCHHVVDAVKNEVYRLPLVTSPLGSSIDAFSERIIRGAPWELHHEHLALLGAQALRFGVRGGLIGARYNRAVGFVTIMSDALTSKKVLYALAIKMDPRLRRAWLDPIKYLHMLIGRLRRQRGPYAVLRWVAEAMGKLIPVAIRAYLEWETLKAQWRSERDSQTLLTNGEVNTDAETAEAPEASLQTKESATHIDSRISHSESGSDY